MSDRDCPAGEACQNGLCGPTLACRSDMDCQAGEACVNGTCKVEDRSCGPNTCAAGEVCCNSSCGICTPMGGSCTQQFCTACQGVMCAEGQVCDPMLNQCVTVECAPLRCGPRLGLSNWQCEDGDIGGPTGRCIMVNANECGWEVNSCPAVCDPAECGTRPTTPSNACMSGAPVALECRRQPDNSCAWAEICL